MSVARPVIGVAALQDPAHVEDLEQLGTLGNLPDHVGVALEPQRVHVAAEVAQAQA